MSIAKKIFRNKVFHKGILLLLTFLIASLSVTTIAANAESVKYKADDFNISIFSPEEFNISRGTTGDRSVLTSSISDLKTIKSAGINIIYGTDLRKFEYHGGIPKGVEGLDSHIKYEGNRKWVNNPSICGEWSKEGTNDIHALSLEKNGSIGGVTNALDGINEVLANVLCFFNACFAKFTNLCTFITNFNLNAVFNNNGVLKVVDLEQDIAKVMLGDSIANMSPLLTICVAVFIIGICVMLVRNVTSGVSVTKILSEAGMLFTAMILVCVCIYGDNLQNINNTLIKFANNAAVSMVDNGSPEYELFVTETNDASVSTTETQNGLFAKTFIDALIETEFGVPVDKLYLYGNGSNSWGISDDDMKQIIKSVSGDETYFKVAVSPSNGTINYAGTNNKPNLGYWWWAKMSNLNTDKPFKITDDNQIKDNESNAEDVAIIADLLAAIEAHDGSNSQAKQIMTHLNDVNYNAGTIFFVTIYSVCTFFAVFLMSVFSFANRAIFQLGIVLLPVLPLMLLIHKLQPSAKRALGTWFTAAVKMMIGQVYIIIVMYSTSTLASKNLLVSIMILIVLAVTSPKLFVFLNRNIQFGEQLNAVNRLNQGINGSIARIGNAGSAYKANQERLSKLRQDIKEAGNKFGSMSGILPDYENGSASAGNNSAIPDNKLATRGIAFNNLSDDDKANIMDKYGIEEFYDEHNNPYYMRDGKRYNSLEAAVNADIDDIQNEKISDIRSLTNSEMLKQVGASDGLIAAAEDLEDYQRATEAKKAKIVARQEMLSKVVGSRAFGLASHAPVLGGVITKAAKTAGGYYTDSYKKLANGYNKLSPNKLGKLTKKMTDLANKEKVNINGTESLASEYLSTHKEELEQEVHNDVARARKVRIQGLQDYADSGKVSVNETTETDQLVKDTLEVSWDAPVGAAAPTAGSNTTYTTGSNSVIDVTPSSTVSPSTSASSRTPASSTTAKPTNNTTPAIRSSNNNKPQTINNNEPVYKDNIITHTVNINEKPLRNSNPTLINRQHSSISSNTPNVSSVAQRGGSAQGSNEQSSSAPNGARFTAKREVISRNKNVFEVKDSTGKVVGKAETKAEADKIAAAHVAKSRSSKLPDSVEHLRQTDYTATKNKDGSRNDDGIIGSTIREQTETRNRESSLERNARKAGTTAAKITDAVTHPRDTFSSQKEAVKKVKEETVADARTRMKGAAHSVSSSVDNMRNSYSDGKTASNKRRSLKIEGNHNKSE